MNFGGNSRGVVGVKRERPESFSRHSKPPLHPSYSSSSQAYLAVRRKPDGSVRSTEIVRPVPPHPTRSFFPVPPVIEETDAATVLSGVSKIVEDFFNSEEANNTLEENVQTNMGHVIAQQNYANDYAEPSSEEEEEFEEDEEDVRLDDATKRRRLDEMKQFFHGMVEQLVYSKHLDSIGEDLQKGWDCINKLLLIKQATNGFTNMKAKVDIFLPRMDPQYRVYLSEDLPGFQRNFNDLTLYYIRSRYFVRHMFTTPGPWSDPWKTEQVKSILGKMIQFLVSLQNKATLEAGYIQRATVIFCCDKKRINESLLSMFYDHKMWPRNFKKQSISNYKWCSKYDITDPAKLQDEKDLDKAKLNNMTKKFEDTSKRYVFLITNYSDTQTLFNNFVLRKTSFHNICIISLAV
jgi:hypothetical protein